MSAVAMTQELENQIRGAFSAAAVLDRVYLFNTIPARKLGNAISRYARVMGSDEVPIMLYDDTVWGSGKDGYLMTNRRIYGRNFASSNSFVEVQSITDIIQGGSSAAPTLMIHSSAGPVVEKQLIMLAANNQAQILVDATRQTVLLLNPGLAGPASSPQSQPIEPAVKARCSGCGATGQVGTKCKWCRSVIV